MAYGLGIDCGTTHTAAAVARDGSTEMLRLGSRRAELPSLVFVPADGPVLVGDAAARRGEAEPGRLAREFKRRIGDPVPILVGGTPLSAHALTARMLEHVLKVAASVHGGQPSSVVLTCPANWGPYKRDLLMQAARLADLPPVTLRTEPEAAAIEHAAGSRVAEGDVIAVYDLGGGTFDAAVLRRTPGGFQVLGEPEGVEQLGGMDFDEAVFDHVVSKLSADLPSDVDDPEVRAALARLRRDCVEAKEALSDDTEVMIPVALPALHTRIRLTRAEFEQMIGPALADTVGAMRRALRSAGVEANEISAFLLCGGSSRIPLVAQVLSTEFGRPVVLDPHPEHSVALGAARITGQPEVPAPAVEQVAATSVAQTVRVAASVPVISSRPVAVWNTSEAAPPRPRPRPAEPAPPPVVKPPRDRRRLLQIIGAALAVLVIAGAGAYVFRRVTDDGRARAAATPPAKTAVNPPSSAPPAACGFVDEFTGTALDPKWEQVRSDAAVTVAGGAATLDAPEGSDIYAKQLAAPMLLRPWTGDFRLETQLTATPAQFYQGAGLVLWNGPKSYVRLELGYGDVRAIVFEHMNGGKHVKTRPPFKRGKNVVRTNSDQVVLQLSRAGDAVTARWRRPDETSFTELDTIKLKLPDTVKAGVSVLNRAQSGNRPAPFSATFERVSLAC